MRLNRELNTPTSSESSDNLEQNPKNSSTLEMNISDRVDSLRMLVDTRKETQNIKKLQRLINHSVEITLFGDSHPTQMG
jgi:hypothetical protein